MEAEFYYYVTLKEIIFFSYVNERWKYLSLSSCQNSLKRNRIGIVLRVDALLCHVEFFSSFCAGHLMAFHSLFVTESARSKDLKRWKQFLVNIISVCFLFSSQLATFTWFYMRRVGKYLSSQIDFVNKFLKSPKGYHVIAAYRIEREWKQRRF